MNRKALIQTLLNFIEDDNELLTLMVDINECVHKTFQNCLECLRLDDDNKMLEIDSILDYLHDDLHTGHWSNIPVKVRQAYAGGCYVKTITLLKNAENCTQTLLKECLKNIDMGLLLGAPLHKNPNLLTQCASALSQQIQSNQKFVVHKRPREEYSCYTNGVPVDVVSCPSLETFNNKYFVPKIPAKLQDCMSTWPALTKWPDVQYLLNIAGERTIPVEIGSHYADENWRQQLMTLKDFIRDCYLRNTSLGYLAQHNLFDQIPELRRDIHVPEYCCLGDDDSEPDINAWFGPAKTVSPLHHDPKNNILCQVFGTKHLILYSPFDSAYLYPHEGNLLSNTAQVNPVKPDKSKYPDFDKAVAFYCILEPGEMLYIPPTWWHYVKALEKSFSVSFWWN